MSIVWYMNETSPQEDEYIYNGGRNALIGCDLYNDRPYEYNDMLYGTIDNPIYKFNRIDDYAGRTYAVAYILVNGTEVNIYSRSAAYNSSIVGVIDPDDNLTYTDTWFTNENLADTTINGKWRAKKAAFTIPSIWISRYGDASIPILATSNKNGVINTGSVFEGHGTLNTNSNQITIGGISISSGENADIVIDFGELPQHLPKLFKDFIELNFDLIYSNTYTIKSDDEQILATIDEQPPIKKTNLQWAGDAFQLSLTGVNDVVQTLTWSNPTPDGKVLKGLSIDPNSTEIIVPVGERVVSIEKSVTFYMVYGEYAPLPVPPDPPPLPERPLTRTFDIYLYQNRAEVNRVGKSPDWLDEVGVMRGALRDECSIVAPVIIFASTVVPNFNYVHIPIFGRYYFVLGIESISTGIWRMRLNCDVLETYKNQIWNLTAVIDRQENDYNPLLNDPNIPAQLNKEIEVLPVNSTDDVLGGGTFDVQSLPDVTHRCEFVLLTVGEGATQ